MEPMIATALPGRVPTPSQDETDSSLDNRARELARNKPRQRRDDEQQNSGSGILPLFPLQSPPLPPALAALRQKGHFLKNDPLSGNAPMSGNAEMKGEAGTALLRKLKMTPVAQTPTTEKSDAIQPTSLANSAVQAPSAGAIPLMKGDTTDVGGTSLLKQQTIANLPVAGTAVPTSGRIEVHEKRPRDEGSVSLPSVSQPVPLSSLRPRIEPQVAMSSHAPVTVPIADTPMIQPGGLTYRFTRWGAEHAVTVQGPTSGALLLQPSDSLVTQQLNAQWQSGDPQKWQLARDGSEGREQRHQQQNEEDEA
jgi:hypothetical protein